MKLQRAVATRIVRLLNKHNMTRYRLCHNIGITETCLRCIIEETTKDVKLSTLANIADGFGMTLTEFFDDPLFAPQNIEID